MACQISRRIENYDLKVLKRQNLPLDRIVDYVAQKNEQKILRYKPRSLNGFNFISQELVIDFKSEAIAHIRHILNNRREYGFLYNMIDDKDPMSHTVFIKYKEFQLVESFVVIQQIQDIAAQFFPRDSDKFDATCLYLLIFYALLVNRHANWITIDHVTHCNRNHQYAAYITWKE